MIIWNIREKITTFLPRDTSTNWREREREREAETLSTSWYPNPQTASKSQWAHPAWLAAPTSFTQVSLPAVFTCSGCTGGERDAKWSSTAYQLSNDIKQFGSEPKVPLLWKRGNEDTCFVLRCRASLRCEGLGMMLGPKITLLGAPLHPSCSSSLLNCC